MLGSEAQGVVARGLQGGVCGSPESTLGPPKGTVCSENTMDGSYMYYSAADDNEASRYYVQTDNNLLATLMVAP